MKYFKLIAILCLFFLISCKKQDFYYKNPIEAIKHINSKNSKISCFSCNISSFFVDSKFYYQKPDRIFLENYFLGKKEAIISLNNQEYWFWIRRFDANSVYYCDYAKLNETTVRHPLRPQLIKSFFCIDQIPDNAILTKSNNLIESVFAQDEYLRIIKSNENNIVEQHWLLNNQNILSIYVLEFDTIARSINVIWHEENHSVKLKVTNFKQNTKMPNQKILNLKKVNLENY